MAIRSTSKIKPGTQRELRGIYSSFANAIRSGREKKQWTRAQLAEKCGIATSSITNIENGRGMSFDTAYAAMHGLGYTRGDVARFITRSGMKS